MHTKICLYSRIQGFKMSRLYLYLHQIRIGTYMLWSSTILSPKNPLYFYTTPIKKNIVKTLNFSCYQFVLYILSPHGV